MFNRGLAAPAGVAAGQVGLAVAIGVKQGGDFRVFELLDIGDLVFFGRFLVDQIALHGAVGVFTLAVQLVSATGVFVEVGVQRIPVVGHEGGVAIGDGDVGGGVFHLFNRLHVVAQLLQRAVDQQGLEGLFRYRALQRLHLDALAGQVLCAGAGSGQANG